MSIVVAGFRRAVSTYTRKLLLYKESEVGKKSGFQELTMRAREDATENRRTSLRWTGNCESVSDTSASGERRHICILWLENIEIFKIKPDLAII